METGDSKRSKASRAKKNRKASKTNDTKGSKHGRTDTFDSEAEMTPLSEINQDGDVKFNN